MRVTLAALPLHAVDLDGRLTLRLNDDDAPAPGSRVVVLGLDTDTLRTVAPHLGAPLTLTLCDGAPAPGPSRDELAARLAACERELTAATQRADTIAALHAETRDLLVGLSSAVRSVAAGTGVPSDTRASGSALVALRTIAARLDREPPQRVVSGGAGVSADVVDGWRTRLWMISAPGPRSLATLDALAADMSRAAAEARAGGAR